MCRNELHLIAETGFTEIKKNNRVAHCCTPCLRANYADINRRRREERAVVDEVVVARLVDDAYWGRASLAERKAAARICIAKGLTLNETARRVGINPQTAGRIKKGLS